MTSYIITSLSETSFVQNAQNKKQENTINFVINGHIIFKFCTGVAHDKTIPHTKKNSEICTEVKDNNAMLLKFEYFCRKALNFKRLYH